MSYCIHCGNELEENVKFCTQCGASADGAKPPPQPSLRHGISGNQEENPHKFKTLRGYAGLISGLGWFLIVGGGICFLIAMVQASGNNETLALGFTIAAVSLLLLGFQFVVSGQLITCFVEIEKNTRLTYGSIKSLQESKLSL